MRYDTVYYHDQALFPTGPQTLSAALHALTAAIDHCRGAGRSLDRDPMVLSLIRNLAEVPDDMTPRAHDHRLPCPEERVAAITVPALLDIAGNSVAGHPAVKRAFHRQVRRILADLASAIRLDPGHARIDTALGDDDDEGLTELRHVDLSVRVVPRSFLPDSEVTFNRCRNGEHAGPVHRAPLAELLDTAAFEQHLAAAIGIGTPRPAAAA